MAINSFLRNWVETIYARAVQDAGFKNCCLESGRYDGSLRNHFFPGVNRRTPRQGAVLFPSRRSQGVRKCACLRAKEKARGVNPRESAISVQDRGVTSSISPCEGDGPGANPGFLTNTGGSILHSAFLLRIQKRRRGSVATAAVL
jgi:hypothetical protein